MQLLVAGKACTAHFVSGNKEVLIKQVSAVPHGKFIAQHIRDIKWKECCVFDSNRSASFTRRLLIIFIFFQHHIITKD